MEIALKKNGTIIASCEIPRPVGTHAELHKICKAMCYMSQKLSEHIVKIRKEDTILFPVLLCNNHDLRCKLVLRSICSGIDPEILTVENFLSRVIICS